MVITEILQYESLQDTGVEYEKLFLFHNLVATDGSGFENAIVPLTLVSFLLHMHGVVLVLLSEEAQ